MGRSFIACSRHRCITPSPWLKPAHPTFQQGRTIDDEKDFRNLGRGYTVELFGGRLHRATAGVAPETLFLSPRPCEFHSKINRRSGYDELQLDFNGSSFCLRFAATKFPPMAHTANFPRGASRQVRRRGGERERSREKITVTMSFLPL
jgi:hypothetical protein